MISSVSASATSVEIPGHGQHPVAGLAAILLRRVRPFPGQVSLVCRTLQAEGIRCNTADAVQAQSAAIVSGARSRRESVRTTASGP
jgi:hypothetical protein